MRKQIDMTGIKGEIKAPNRNDKFLKTNRCSITRSSLRLHGEIREVDELSLGTFTHTDSCHHYLASWLKEVEDE